MRTYSMTNPFMHGDDLKPLQAKLKANHLYAGRVDGVFGVSTGNACKAQKYRLGYPLKACVRTGGQTLLNYLNGTTQLPPDYIVRRTSRGYGPGAPDALRQRIVDNAMWGVTNTAQIHYQQSRPIDGIGHPHKLPLYTDCSGFVTDCFNWAGAKDPNGFNYNGLGFTGTLMQHGVWVALAQAKKGDLVIWGVYPGHHVAMIESMATPLDPMIVSHGSEAGPMHIHLSAENAAQGRPYMVRSYV